MCEHVYIGRPWERPHALGCCYFNARDLGELDDEENGSALDALIERRQAVLTSSTSTGTLSGTTSRSGTTSSSSCPDARCSRVTAESGPGPTLLDATSPTLLDATSDLWQVHSEEQAERQLLSFAAAATLGPADRMQALTMSKTVQRLDFVLAELHEQRNLLTSLLDMPLQ